MAISSLRYCVCRSPRRFERQRLSCVSGIYPFIVVDAFAHDRQNSLDRENPLVEETDDLAGNLLATGLLVVHNTGGGGENDETELTSWEELDNPLLEVVKTDVVAWGDDTGLVGATVKLDDDLAGAVVIDLLELSDVTWIESQYVSRI